MPSVAFDGGVVCGSINRRCSRLVTLRQRRARSLVVALIAGLFIVVGVLPAVPGDAQERLAFRPSTGSRSRGRRSVSKLGFPRNRASQSSMANCLPRVSSRGGGRQGSCRSNPPRGRTKHALSWAQLKDVERQKLAEERTPRDGVVASRDSVHQEVLRWFPQNVDAVFVVRRPASRRDLSVGSGQYVDEVKRGGAYIAVIVDEETGAMTPVRPPDVQEAFFDELCGELEEAGRVTIDDTAIEPLLKCEASTIVSILRKRDMNASVMGNRERAESAIVYVCDKSVCALFDAVIGALVVKTEHHGSLPVHAVRIDHLDESRMVWCVRLSDTACGVFDTLAFAIDVVDRIQNGESDRRVALPESLIEWKYVNVDAPVWGIQHFPAYDPKDRANFRAYDELVEGVVFEYWHDPVDRHPGYEVVVLGGGHEVLKVAKDYWRNVLLFEQEELEERWTGHYRYDSTIAIRVEINEYTSQLPSVWRLCVLAGWYGDIGP